MAWGGDKTSGFLLTFGDFHILSSDRNCGYWLITSDSTCQDEHNGWFDVCSHLENWIQHRAWRGEVKNEQVSISFGDYHNVWSEWNCGYRLILAYRMHQDEHNGRFNFCMTLKIEYSTEHGVGRKKSSRFLLASGDWHNVWSNLNCNYYLIAADRTRRDDHNGLSHCFSHLENWIQHRAWRGEEKKRAGFY